MDDLNDLRFVAAVAETGSLSGAARRLRVNHATAFRRIARVEQRLGVRLFERASGRYTPTIAGEELARVGATIEHQTAECLHKLAGRDLLPNGLVRITTTDSIASYLIGSSAKACQDEYPGIQLQIVTANEIYNLTKRDADIAIRATPKPPEHLAGVRISPVALAIYGNKQYVKRYQRKSLAEHRWIALDDSLSQTASVRWLAKTRPVESVEVRTNTYPAIRHACASGLGLAILPCFVGDADSALRRVGDPIAECASSLWLLTHPDIRETTRIKSIFGVFQRELGRLASLISGNGFRAA